MQFLAKRFCPSRARDRKRSGDISELQAFLYFFTANVLVNKSGVKTVARAHGVDRGAR